MTLPKQIRLLIACAALLCACNREPYPLDGTEGPDLPDEDHAALEADLHDPGHEMHVMTDAERLQQLNGPCVNEDAETFRARNTHADRYTDDIGQLPCPIKPVVRLDPYRGVPRAWTPTTTPAPLAPVVPVAAAVAPPAPGATLPSR